MVEKNDHKFVASIHRKPTFVANTFAGTLFCPMKRKTNLISTLVHKALAICSESTLQNELYYIRTILINNGYLEAVKIRNKNKENMAVLYRQQHSVVN